MLKKEGHSHTKFSHHGSQEPLDAYIDRALELGFDDYVVTEHAPLPDRFYADFQGPAEMLTTSAMTKDELNQYRAEVDRVKNKYAGKIHIKAGLEVDYLPGYDREIHDFLKENADWLEEVVLSVHFMANDQGVVGPIDYDEQTLADYFPTEMKQPQRLFARYFDTVAASLAVTDGLAFPIRVGHLTLIRKYQHYFDLPGFDDSVKQQVQAILTDMQARGLAVDFNAAGYSKPYNGQSYPTFDIVAQAVQQGLPLVYGSDAHRVSELGLHYDEMADFLASLS
ncbi:histidinol-phosphatase HisJ [Lactobacillaceae bacterium L1_55_11]|nr:histidinol-phosphatase HisJ [Lactobacillaceae bacterium L1_55_11]